MLYMYLHVREKSMIGGGGNHWQQPASGPGCVPTSSPVIAKLFDLNEYDFFFLGSWPNERLPTRPCNPKKNQCDLRGASQAK
jgi:hypothetical protein